MHFRLDVPQPRSGSYCTVGVLVSSSCHDVSAAVVAVDRDTSNPQSGILAVNSARVPDETAALFAHLGNTPNPALGSLLQLRSQLTEIEASLVAELLAELPGGHGPVVAAGVLDPGLWQFSQNPPQVGYLGLSDSARLGELTGLNVIDEFPARDLAQGGQGGPLTAIAEWILLRDPVRTRLLLHLGATVRLSFLPAAAVPAAMSRVLSFDVGPGMKMLDLLTQRLTAGQQRFDVGGRLAVQGRRIPELLTHWLSDPYFDRPLPRWHPRGVRPERFLADSVDMAVRQGWSVRDLLCTATHFIADTVALAVQQRLPDDLPLDRIIVTGGGQHNGMLLNEITDRLPQTPLVRVGDLGMPPEALAPAKAAVLAMLYVDQTPANSTAITGTEVPRILGHLTPGSPQNWQTLLHLMAASRTQVRALRAAV